MRWPQLLVTLCPSFDHFKDFADNNSLWGIRLNTAMLSPEQIKEELELAAHGRVPVWFDIKARQLRVTEIVENPDYLELRLNHPISVPTPCEVLFKAGSEKALLGELKEDGRRLLFCGNPAHIVWSGESLHIRHPELVVDTSELITKVEQEKIKLAQQAGINKWFLSYVESQDDVETFRGYVGEHAEICLKIESPAGVHYAANNYKKDSKTRLVAACGDLFVEVPMPHNILPALRTIIKADPDAIVASRMLLSLTRGDMPSFADLCQLEWFHEIGYRSFMLCDDLCTKPKPLTIATNVFDAWRDQLCSVRTCKL